MPGPVSESYRGPSDPPIRTASDFVDVLLEFVDGGLLEGVSGVGEVRGVDDRRTSIVMDVGYDRTRIYVLLATSLEVVGAPGVACRCAEIAASDMQPHFDGCLRRGVRSATDGRGVAAGAQACGPARVGPIQTVDDLVDALGDLVEDEALEGVLGLDDDGVVGGKRLLALVLNDDEQARIRFSLSTSPEDAGAVDAACRCAEIVVEDPARHLDGCPRRVSYCAAETDCVFGFVGEREVGEEEP